MHTEFQDILQAAIDAGVAFDAILTEDERQLVAAYRDHQELPLLPQVALTAEGRQQAEEDFATLAAAEALLALARKIETVLTRRREELYVQCLEAFYAAEELSRDPAHADLIPHVEAMRRAHEKDYGCPIPPRSGH